MQAKLKDYIWIDLQRAFGNRKIFLGVFGVCIVFLYNNYMPDSAIGWVSEITSISALSMAAFLFASYPYATAFCEDREYRYDMQMTLRGNSFSYACARLIVVFLSSLFTMLMGFFLATLFICLKYGLISQSAIDNISSGHGHYYQLAVQGDYALYILCAGLQIGSLAGTLAVIGLMCSLFVRNRMLVYIFPVALLYVEDILVQRLLGWEVGSIFSLRSMGIATLQFTVNGQSWWLYYFEIFMILLCCSAIVCWKTGRR